MLFTFASSFTIVKVVLIEDIFWFAILTHEGSFLGGSRAVCRILGTYKDGVSEYFSAKASIIMYSIIKERRSFVQKLCWLYSLHRDQFGETWRRWWNSTCMLFRPQTNALSTIIDCRYNLRTNFSLYCPRLDESMTWNYCVIVSWKQI